jgi:NAD(P)-dependent dehydrogenase (short-subunit alcohol dehydrogenase family)
MQSMQGKTVLITGANSGIGKASAAGVARLGAHVVMVCRSPGRGRKALDDIARNVPGASLELLLADLSTRTAVESLAIEFKQRHDRLDVLFNNAGIMTSRRRVTSEGFELAFFVNYLSFFMLTGLLLDVLLASTPSRIVNMSSSSQSSGQIDFDDLQLEHPYRGFQAYANTNAMRVAFTYQLAHRLRDTKVTANCLHPGVIHTGLMRNVSPVVQWLFDLTGRFFKSPEDGAETPVYLMSSPEVDGVSGKYFRYCRPMDTTEHTRDPEVRRRLWAESERLSGVRYHFPGQSDLA